MSNYAKYSLQTDAIRTELHDELNLTGCEISCNQMPAGAAVPFVHKHKENEEVYLITQGGGEFYLRLAANTPFVRAWIRPRILFVIPASVNYKMV